MNNTSNNNLSAHEIFWLAHYAYNTLNPLLNEARKIEPSIGLRIEIDTAAKARGRNQNSSLSIVCHWDRERMFLFEHTLTSKEDIDAVAEQVRAETAKLEPLTKGETK